MASTPHPRPTSRSDIKRQQNYQLERPKHLKKQEEMEKECKKQKKIYKNEKRKRRYHFDFGAGNLGSLGPRFSPGVSLSRAYLNILLRYWARSMVTNVRL
jgi:hypothetical protein